MYLNKFFYFISLFGFLVDEKYGEIPKGRCPLNKYYYYLFLFIQIRTQKEIRRSIIIIVLNIERKVWRNWIIFGRGDYDQVTITIYGC